MGGLFGGGGNQTISNSETPLTAFKVQTSIYGSPVPLLYGRNRVPGNLIWYGRFLAIPHTTSQSSGGGGGKGGGGGGTTTVNTSYTYQADFALALCEGQAHSINNYWVDKAYTAGLGPFTAFTGSGTQTPWSYFPTGSSLAYRGVTYAAAAAYDLGNSDGLGNHSFDVTGLLPYAAGTIDGANPKDIITDYLTHATHGAGLAPGYLGDWTAFSNWCIANSVFLSPAYDKQASATQSMTDLMQVVNAGIFFSEGLLKIVPYSDTAATAHGITYTPATSPAYDLGDDDFLDPAQPIKVMRTPSADACNQVQLEYLDSANQYNVAIATAQDQASIETYGLAPLAVITAHQITDANTAQLIARLILQRILFTRNVYEFKLGWKYARLEPCDYVTLTDARLGFDHLPVRILSVEEDDSGELTLQAEDAPAGVLHSPLYDSPAGSGYNVNFGVSPGNVVAPAFFEGPASHALSGLTVGVAVTGNDPNWGGCEVWASNDGTSYSYLGRVTGGARYGSLITSGITAAAGQTANVALVGNGGQILGGSTADANNLSTLAIVGSEYAAYTTSTLLAANQYALALAVRGAYGTPAAAHAIGTQFIRADSAIIYSQSLDLAMVGKTLYFKFLSFNIYGGGKQALADVAAYTYTVTGIMAQLAPASASAVTLNTSAGAVFVGWTNPADMSNVDRTEILRSATPILSAATVIGSVRGTIGFYSDFVGSSGVTNYYWVRQINRQGYPSTAIGGSSATTGAIGGTPGAGSIVNSMLTANCVLANNISVSQLDALSATIGVLRTATSGARMEIRDNVIKVYDSSGTLRVRMGNLSL